jgi:vacuolar protein sorting-associated protein 35
MATDNSRNYHIEEEDTEVLQSGQTHEEKQKLLLSEAMNVVNTEAYRMRRALDKNLLEEALKHSAKMLSQLRTSELSPKNYYDLCKCLYTNKSSNL